MDHLPVSYHHKNCIAITHLHFFIHGNVTQVQHKPHLATSHGIADARLHSSSASQRSLVRSATLIPHPSHSTPSLQPPSTSVSTASIRGPPPPTLTEWPHPGSPHSIPPLGNGPPAHSAPPSPPPPAASAPPQTDTPASPSASPHSIPPPDAPPPHIPADTSGTGATTSQSRGHKSGRLLKTWQYPLH
jgi:hypothetical protein